MIQQFQTSLNKFKTMEKKSNRNWLWFLGVVVLWLGSYFVINYMCGNADGPGTFGDQFGAINALFTGLSFAAIIITLRLQQQELNAQRREFITSRAMTIVYKQVELVVNVINNSGYNDYPLSLKAWTPEKYKENEIKGIYAFNRLNDLISRSPNKLEKIKELKGNMNYMLNSISNSASLLEKTRKNENMTDDDALFVFESFKYNIDHRVWSFIETLRQVNWQDADIEVENIKNEVLNICSFLDDMESLKTKTNLNK